MPQNISKRFEKNGFAALISTDKKTILKVVPAVENQIYCTVGISIIFAETKQELENNCLAAGCTPRPELFSDS